MPIRHSGSALPLFAAGASLAFAACSSGAATSDAVADGGSPGAKAPLEIHVLAINDFHGNLEPPPGNGGRLQAHPGDPEVGDGGVDLGVSSDTGPLVAVDVGGAAYLAAHLRKRKAGYPAGTPSIVVSAGDLTGASPLVSAAFHDEPTIAVMNALGLELNAVGNHEFDHGVAELKRLQTGGCFGGAAACEAPAFEGAKFKYLAANVETGPRTPLFPRYDVRDFDGEKVAFVGMTLEGTPSVTVASNVSSLTFKNEVTTVNSLVPELRAMGVSGIVVLVHQGGTPPTTQTYDECNLTSGPIYDIATGLDPAVDVVVSGHTHAAYNCILGGKLVTSAASAGRLLTDVTLTVDRAKHRVSKKAAHQILVTRGDVTPDPEVSAIVDRAVSGSASAVRKVIGRISATLVAPRSLAMPNVGEASLGDVVADAQLAATRAAPNRAVIAMTNQGGIRADIAFSGSGDVTYGDAFAAQPFTNALFTVSLTGAQIKAILDGGLSQASPSFLQVSAGFSYAYSLHPRPHLVGASLDGVPLGDDVLYRVTVNNFLVQGGDGYTGFLAGMGQTGGPIDLDALVQYFSTAGVVSPPPATRIAAQ